MILTRGGAACTAWAPAEHSWGLLLGPGVTRAAQPRQQPKLSQQVLDEGAQAELTDGDAVVVGSVVAQHAQHASSFALLMAAHFWLDEHGHAEMHAVRPALQKALWDWACGHDSVAAEAAQDSHAMQREPGGAAKRKQLMTKQAELDCWHMSCAAVPARHAALGVMVTLGSRLTCAQHSESLCLAHCLQACHHALTQMQLLLVRLVKR